MNGIVNVLKPAGMTSHDVVYRLRKIYGIRKIGHAGTLDPLAAGVLPIFLGQATRLLEFAEHDPKIYIAEWLVGMETDTEDTSGTVIRADVAPRILQKDWEQSAARWIGTIQQSPSLYSAIKVGGRKAYELAREGKKIELPKREVQIWKISDIDWQSPYLRARVACSSGTYIRALGRDWAKSIGTVATMSFLLREQVGIWHINSSSTLEEIAQEPMAALQPSTQAVSHLPAWQLTDELAKRFQHGQRLAIRKENVSGLCRMYREEEFLGIGEYDGEILRARKVWGKE